MNETVVGDTWLHTVLTGDSSLSALVTGVHQEQAPEDSAYPFVVFEWLGGSDLMVVNGIRVWHSGVWVVKGVDKASSFTKLASVDARIDALLHRKSGTVASGVVASAVREAPHRLPETSDGVRYLQLGGRYRLTVQQA